MRDSTIRVVKTKVLISFVVTVKLICTFVFAYVDSWFSHAAAHIVSIYLLWSGNIMPYDTTITQLGTKTLLRS